MDEEDTSADSNMPAINTMNVDNLHEFENEIIVSNEEEKDETKSSTTADDDLKSYNYDNYEIPDLSDDDSLDGDCGFSKFNASTKGKNIKFDPLKLGFSTPEKKLPLTAVSSTNAPIDNKENSTTLANFANPEPSTSTASVASRVDILDSSIKEFNPVNNPTSTVSHTNTNNSSNITATSTAPGAFTQVKRKRGRPRKNQIQNSNQTSTPEVKMEVKPEPKIEVKMEVDIKPKIEPIKEEEEEEAKPEIKSLLNVSIKRKEPEPDTLENSNQPIITEPDQSIDYDDDDDHMLDQYHGSMYTRRQIRHIYKNYQLEQKTREADEAENQRRKRLQEKEKILAEQILPNISNASKRLILDFDRDTKQVMVEVNSAWIPYLKDHQKSGVRFMYDSTIESLRRMEEQEEEDFEKKNPGVSNGGILAHCMGLGKTFQVVVFVHSILSNPYTSAKISKVLIMVPLNVIKNWENEFDKWFEMCNLRRKFHLFELYSTKTHKSRAERLEQWHKKGGVMLITAGLFAELLVDRKKNDTPERRKYKPVFERYLLEPGPDMVIIDEGHIIKNDETRLSLVCSRIKTLRRLILTGTPMQNHLGEYYVMVNFVKKDLLGSKKEFRNRFENPITNGQYIDSEPYDVHLMKCRYYVLNMLLDACIHRGDYAILAPCLPPKCEYVLSVKLSKEQVDIYQHSLDAYVYGRVLGKTAVRQLFLHFRLLGLIWNHPALLVDYFKDCQKRVEKLRLLEGDDDDDDNENDQEEADDAESKKNRKKTLHMVRLIMGDWPNQYLPQGDDLYRLELGPKFKLLMSILEICERQRNKLLVFSQSLDVLDLIERFLNEKTKRVAGQMVKCFTKNEDYFRIDGSVNSSERMKIVDQINDAANQKARLLLASTLAGGIGINLVGANRCVIFDACWNPTHDRQALFRIFRFGQTRPVYVYRFSSYGTMESKIYKRQITKESISLRVVDSVNVERYFTSYDLQELYKLEIENNPTELPIPYKDPLLASLWPTHRDFVVSYHEHDSLLENRPEEELTAEQRALAWAEFEKERKQGEQESRNNQGGLTNNEVMIVDSDDNNNNSGYDASLANHATLAQFYAQQQANNARILNRLAAELGEGTSKGPVVDDKCDAVSEVSNMKSEDDIKPKLEMMDVKPDIKPQI